MALPSRAPVPRDSSVRLTQRDSRSILSCGVSLGDQSGETARSMKPPTDDVVVTPLPADSVADSVTRADAGADVNGGPSDLALDAPTTASHVKSPPREVRTATTPLWHWLSLNHGDQRWLLALGVLFFSVTGVQWIRMTQQPDPLPWQRSESFDRLFRVDVNNATWIEWSQLEGIGPGYAHRIVADRQVNGPFSSIDDVTRVPGIGKATLDRVRPWLTISQGHFSH